MLRPSLLEEKEKNPKTEDLNNPKDSVIYQLKNNQLWQEK
jgi:hypothetical protein